MPATSDKNLALSYINSEVRQQFWVEIIEMVSFELGKELRKMFFRPVTSVGQGKILSPHEKSNLRPSGFALRCSTTEPGVQKIHRSQFTESIRDILIKKGLILND